MRTIMFMMLLSRLNIDLGISYSQKMSTIASWLDNLNQLEVILTENHINPYTTISKGELRRSFSSLRERLSLMIDDQIKVAFLEIISSVKDSHTNAVIPVESLFPLTFSYFDDGAYCLMASKEFSDVVGLKLAGIGNCRIEQVCDKMLRISPHDNKSQLEAMVTECFIRPDILNGLQIVSSKKNVIYHFIDKSGKPKSIAGNAVPFSQLGSFRKTMVTFVPVSPHFISQGRG